MDFVRFGIVLLCLVVYSACQNSPGTSTTGYTDDNITETITGEIIWVTDDWSLNDSYITNQENNTESVIDENHDIIITGTATPGNNVTSDVTESSTEESTFTMIFDDTDNSTNITTTVTEEIRTACSLSPCRNGGTCIEDDVVPFLFSCTCPSGFVGIRCGTVDKCVVNDDEEVCKNGACVYSKDGLMRSCKCFMGTYWDDQSKECKDPDPPCFPNPCMNGGTCDYQDDMFYCQCPNNYGGKNCSVLDKCGNCSGGDCVYDDKRTTKYCKCNEGLYWNEEKQACKEMTSPCDLRPCMNGGTCNPVSDSEYNCTCAEGFSGTVCEITDLCDSNQHCGQGRCILSDNNKTRSCHCNNGYYLEEYFHTCEKITNLCQPNPCLNDGICTVVSASSFNCTCSEGYKGKTCNVRDMCKMDGGDAYCGNGICGNNNDLSVYFCTCKGEEYFQYSERKCVELDMCPLVQCDSTQKCLMGNCECKDNYKWNNITMKCEPDFCSSNPCPTTEMICVEGTGSTDYKCHCKEGQAFNGTHCNVASCSFPKLNSCNQHCSWEDGAYECSCDEDFILKEDNHTCTYVGNSTCSNKTCDKGFCVKKDGIEICICPPGFTEKGGACKDVCSAGLLPSGVCPSEGCEATDHGFKCKCDGKFTLSQDKTTCMVRNVCQTNEIGWNTCTEANAECVIDWLSKDGFQCVCATGQVKEAGICRDLCSIENNQRQCSIKGATCNLDIKAKMICKCPPYFKANERDGKCSQPADYSYLVTLPLAKSTYVSGKRQKRSLDPSADYRKILKDVTVTMREMYAGFSQASVVSCKALSAYLLCKVELQFSIEPGKSLKRLETNDICLSNGNSNYCLLPPSLVLVKNRINEVVKIQSTDPCDEDIKDRVCGSDTNCVSLLSHKSLNCSCKTGYITRGKNYPFGNTKSFIEICTDIDECALGDPCPANSICTNTIGSYSCSCKSGFRGEEDAPGSNSQKCVELCYPNPCIHGVCSGRGDHEFDCRCEAGFRGSICNLRDENFKRARTNTIIVGVVLGGVLLITFILFAACISRLRKQKSLDSSGQMFYSSTEMTERRRVDGGAVNNAFRRD